MTKSDVLTEKSVRGGGICSIDSSRSIHHKFFKSISILISVFAFSVAGAACGGSDKDKPEPEQDAGVDCPAGYWGENCDNNTITCEHGTPSLGREGTGKCSSCHPNTGWTGENCDVCEGNYWGANCNQAPSCSEHGTPSLGIEGTGLCTECEEGWDLEQNCAELLDNYILDKAGNVYKTTKIGNQTWMAKNMAWQDESVTCGANTEADADFIKNYGCLYTWADANKVCPDGWKIPAKEDFEKFLEYVETHKQGLTEHGETVFLALIADAADWGHAGITSATNEFDFSALPAGRFINGNYADFGEKAAFWSATDFDEFAYALGLGWQTSEINSGAKNNMFSVRCLKIENTCVHGTLDPQTGHCQAGTCEGNYIGKDCSVKKKCVHGTLDEQTGNCQAGTCETGFDGENCDIAVTSSMNGQIWMAKNMDATTGNDGSTLTCHANPAVSNFVEHYGCLYTWEDANKVCPAGWHLPDEAEITALTTYSFLQLIARSADWTDYQGMGTDDFGFGALPGGALFGDNTYGDVGVFTDLWSSKLVTDEDGSNPCPHYLSIGYGDFDFTCDDTKAASVRCLKDAAQTE